MLRPIVTIALVACSSGAPTALAPVQAPVPSPARPDAVDEPLSDRVAKLDTYLADELAKLRVPGAIAAVIGRDGIVWSKAYGVRDLATNAPVTPDTRFRLGSLTKVVTALAVLQLRDAGKLELDAPVSTYLPELAAVTAPTSDSPPITLRHLMTHTSGLPREPQLVDPYGRQHEVTESELLASLAATKLESSPGTTFRYSNLGAALEGLVIARVAGEPYAEHVEAHLLRPLGMATATFDRGKIPGQALATSYLRDGTGAPAKVATPLREGATAARGQLYATIGDVAKLASFELRAWPARDEPDPGPVRRATVRESQRTIGPFPPVTHTKGAGWFLDATPRGAIVSHGGAGEGFMTELWLSTSANLAFAILINDDDPGIARLARHAQELLLPRIASPLELVVRLLDDPSEATARQLVEPDYLIGMRSRGSLAKLASLHANLGACSVASTDATEASEDRELVHGTIACGTRTLSVSVASTDTDPAQIAFLRIE